MTPERRKQLDDLAQWAADVLDDPRVVIVDTETTGLENSARIVDLAVATTRREILLDTLVNPSEPIPPGAIRVHHITDAMVADAPAFGDVLPELARVLRGRRVLVYNEEYDVARFGHELNLLRDNYDPQQLEVGRHWIGTLGAVAEDAMIPYSDFYGEWSEWHGNYSWQKLNGGHRAAGDCLAVVDCLEEMRRGK